MGARPRPRDEPPRGGNTRGHRGSEAHPQRVAPREHAAGLRQRHRAAGRGTRLRARAPRPPPADDEGPPEAEQEDDDDDAELALLREQLKATERALAQREARGGRGRRDAVPGGRLRGRDVRAAGNAKIAAGPRRARGRAAPGPSRRRGARPARADAQAAAAAALGEEAARDAGQSRSSSTTSPRAASCRAASRRR